MHQKKFFCFTMFLVGICILLYGLNDKLTALANQKENLEKSSISSFEFLDKDEYTIKVVNGLLLKDIIKIQNDNTFSSYEIDGYKKVRSNKLTIDCMEAINMKELWDGSSAICIDYKGRYLEEELIENEAVGLLEKYHEYIKIGEISLNSTNKEPYFRISNEEATIGIGTKNISIPSKVYDIMPIEVSDFSVYSYVKQMDNNYIEGSIIIMGEKINGSMIDKISLSELNLEEEHLRTINGRNVEDSTLEIVKNYVFKIPLSTMIKDEKLIFDINNEGYNAFIEVELPLRYKANVYHK